MNALLIGMLMAALAAAFVQWQRLRALRRETFIRTMVLPKGLFEKLVARHPQLGTKDCQLVAQGLRQFFLAYLKSGRRFVAMPSQVVDDLWHEFILCTRSYDHFCRHAFGGFLHHTPAVILGSDSKVNEGLHRCWNFACREENINPRNPTRLPLLFALDAKLNIHKGYTYVPDCRGVRRQAAGDSATASTSPHCAGDFSSSSLDGASDAYGDNTADVGASDSGGCGGGGCGGGGGD